MNNIIFKFKIGDLVRIKISPYYAYYGYADCILVIKEIKIDNAELDCQMLLDLKTQDGKSIEGESNTIWVFAKYVYTITEKNHKLI